MMLCVKRNKKNVDHKKKKCGEILNFMQMRNEKHLTKPVCVTMFNIDFKFSFLWLGYQKCIKLAQCIYNHVLLYYI